MKQWVVDCPKCHTEIRIGPLGVQCPHCRAELAVGRRFDDHQIVIDCRGCGRDHYHGLAGDDGNGHRVAHCLNPRAKFKENGYWVIPQEWIR